jgi:ferredoxin--NADP+ reductase
VAELNYYTAVVGAGPAGLFAAKELARSGVKVVIFNRDIKPGGLAEYGIYPDKQVMKEGMRNQFKQVLDTPGISYCGNVTVGEQGDISLADLRALGFQAVLVTVGAQGTKWLGLPGEHLKGVYHAKDLVYYYNRLPPFSQKDFQLGKRVAVVGAGNVMLDIARYAIQKVKADEVIAVVRRGPAEVKFDRKEMEYVVRNLDERALEEEFQRIGLVMTAIGQDPAAARATILEALPKAQPSSSTTRFRFEFLVSPVAMQGDEQVSGLEVEDNLLVLKDGEVKARGTGNKRVLKVDSVVFAIGDTVDDHFGLPVVQGEYAKNPEPRFPMEGESFETFDPQAGKVIADVFVAGWSRRASTGLVGYARKDGTNGARAVLQYLQTLTPGGMDEYGLRKRLRQSGKPVVTQVDIRKLAEIEADVARHRGLPSYKFASNEEMLEKIMSIG